MIHVPSVVFKGVKHIVVDFIWEGKTSKIAYDVLIQQTEEYSLICYFSVIKLILQQKKKKI